MSMKLMVVGFVFASVLMSFAQEASHENASELRAPSEQARIVAYRQIVGESEMLIDSLLDVVRTDKSEDFHGGKSLAIQILGRLRAQRSVGVLLDNIMFCPLGRDVEESITTQQYYIAAVALVEIGKPAVQEVTVRMYRTGDMQEARLCAWVIKQIEGLEIAIQICEDIERKPDKNRKERGMEMKKYLTEFTPTFNAPKK